MKIRAIYIYIYIMEWWSQAILLNLKNPMFTKLVLEMPNFTKTFVLECDSLGKGLGVVLMQEGSP